MYTSTQNCRKHVCLLRYCARLAYFNKRPEIHGLCKDLFCQGWDKDTRLMEAEIRRIPPQEILTEQATTHAEPAVPIAVWLTDFLSQIIFVWKSMKPLNKPPSPCIREEKNRILQTTLSFMSSFLPHLKGLQFLKWLLVICVAFIPASPEMSCQITVLGNSVVFFPHRVTLCFISYPLTPASSL